MAHLWHIQDKQWQPREVRAGLLAVGAQVRLCAGGNEAWVLIASPSAWVRVNGQPIALGIRSLRDRDEIVVDSSRYYFSAERSATVAPFPGAEGAVICPRCRKEIAKDSPAVRCPRCGTFHHQREDRACWSYSAKCGLCDADTALDAGFRWQPES